MSNYFSFIHVMWNFRDILILAFFRKVDFETILNFRYNTIIICKFLPVFISVLIYPPTELEWTTYLLFTLSSCSVLVPPFPLSKTLLGSFGVFWTVLVLISIFYATLILTILIMLANISSECRIFTANCMIILFRSSPKSHFDFAGTFFANGFIFFGKLLLRCSLLNGFNSDETKPKNAKESMREDTIFLTKCWL